jgi:hypothetical protein
MKKIKLFGAGHVKNCPLEELAEDTSPVTEIALCKYSTECRKECPESSPCRIRSFYEKYGPDYRELGVGS